MIRLSAAVVVLMLSVSAGRADDRALAERWKMDGNHVKIDKDGRLVEVTFAKSESLSDADYQQLPTLEHLRKLTFYGKCTMTDAQAASVGKVMALEELAANGTALSDAGFAHLGRLPNLRSLVIWHLGWQNKEQTGRGFASLAGCPKLERLNFGGSTVGDEGLKALGAVKTLKTLEFGHTRVTDAGLANLNVLPLLTAVTAGPQFSMRVGDAGLATLASVPTLETITYNETILTYDGSLRLLKELKRLKAVKLEKVEVSVSDMAKLKADLPGVAIDHTPPPPDKLEQMRKILAKK